MEELVVSFEQLVARFPRIANKSKRFAKSVLPLYASPELASLVAALMTDGHVEWYTSDGRPRAKRVTLYSSEKIECEWFLDLVKRLFGVEGKLESYATKSGFFKKQPFKAHVFKAVVANILILAGAPAGNKTEKEFLVPEWVMKGSKEVKRAFLRTFFTFEASRPRAKTNREFSFEIGLTMVKRKDLLGVAFQFFAQLKKLLREFEVNPTNTISYPKANAFKASKHAFCFSITQQESIVNFYRNVGYFNPAKQRALKEAVITISKFGRVKSNGISNLIKEIKGIFGTDKMLAMEVSKFTEKTYSNRQLEHFRRNETKIPLELLFALIKIKKKKAILNELPEYVKYLYCLNSISLLRP